MNRFKTILLLCLLVLLVIVSRVTGEAGMAVFAAGDPPPDTGMKRDLLALMLAYPNNITGVEKSADGSVCVVMSSGEKIVYDDGRDKSFDGKLADADLQDMMEQPYPLDMITAVPEGSSDPGRIRCYALLRVLYGGTQSGIEANLRRVSGCGPFNQKAGAASALEAALGDVNGLIGVQPGVSGYVYPVNGTYNYRVIAGTGSLSPHAFGIAIDLKSNPSDYWRWASKEQGQKRLETYPADLVKTMESHGFIWGGKWAHFDYLHFEYRPELIVKARADAARPGNRWHAGFPEDAATKELVEKIDAALE